MPLHLKERHYFLEAATEINALCKPLNRFGILHLTYMKTFSDGSQIYLSNNAKWIKDYYQYGLYLSSSFEGTSNQYNSGFSLWPVTNNSEVLSHGRKYFDSCNGITYIKKNMEECEFFFFSGAVKNSQLINFYLNNLDILELFSKYFKEKANLILKQAEKNKIITPDSHIYRNNCNILTQAINEPSRRMQFISEIQPSNNFYSQAKLSNQETECIKRVSKGKTSKEIARELNISQRTVETHLSNARLKFHCKNKIELLSKLSQLSVISF